jgi:hypothetical protein
MTETVPTSEPYEATEMKVFAQHHLTADELDTLHEGAELDRVTSHLVTCDNCRAMVELDVRLLKALSALPQLDPSAGFLARVVDAVGLGAESPDQLLAATGESTRAREARRRVWVGGAVGGGLVTAGFAWAFANPDAAVGIALPAFSEMTDALWFSVQGVVANTVEQPWFGTMRDSLASPARALPVLAFVAAAYTVGLLSLRRLLTRPATNASW